MVFASELKALLAGARPELGLDLGALVASMLYYWVPEQRCAIEGVEKLPPGRWAEFRPDGSCGTVHRTGRSPTSAAEAAAGAACRPRAR